MLPLDCSQCVEFRKQISGLGYELPEKIYRGNGDMIYGKVILACVQDSASTVGFPVDEGTSGSFVNSLPWNVRPLISVSSSKLELEP